MLTGSVGIAGGTGEGIGDRLRPGRMCSSVIGLLAEQWRRIAYTPLWVTKLEMLGLGGRALAKSGYRGSMKTLYREASG